MWLDGGKKGSKRFESWDFPMFKGQSSEEKPTKGTEKISSQRNQETVEGVMEVLF